MESPLLVALAVAVTALVTGVGVAAAMLLWVGRENRAIEAGTKKRSKGAQDSFLEVIAARLAAVEVTVAGIPGLLKEERERTKKHADRAQQAERDLEARLERLQEESEEDGDLLDDDESGGGQQLLLPVQQDVAEPASSLQERATQTLAIFGRR